MRYYKYHGLGNDYLVLDPLNCPQLPSDREIRVVCHRNYGLGSDGILFGPLPSSVADCRLRILNPDASEAEKSGNGLRIFARFLVQQGYQSEGKTFTVETIGGIVRCLVSGEAITVDMGKVRFEATAIPVNGYSGEVVAQTIEVNKQLMSFSAATIGNPHAVFPVDELSEALARQIGPHIETHPAFPNRTNVQFLKVIDRHTIQIEIWERGAGYTLASGSSSSAAGAVAKRLGWVDSPLTVRMPGGTIQLEIDEGYTVTMTGPAVRVGMFELDPDCLNAAP